MTTPDDEALYQRAAAIVVENAKASTSWLQRQLRIGFNSAARLIERMEAEGYVSRPDHVGRREVLMPPSSTMLGSSVRIQSLADDGDGPKPAFAEPKTATVMAAIGEADSGPLVETAVDLVQQLGLEGARRAVRAAADAAGEAEAFRRPKAKSDHLTAFVERAEHLYAERDGIAQEIRDLFKFAKDIGLDPSSIRKVVKDRATDQDKRFTAEAIYLVYRHALGIEDPDFVIDLPPPSVPPPVKGRKLTAKEKTYQETLASVAASRSVLVQ